MLNCGFDRPMKSSFATGVVVALLAACSSSANKVENASGLAANRIGFAPLEHGADHSTYEKMNKTAFVSPTHGKRFVDVFVNQVGAAAYKSNEAEFPVGTVIVKTSRESENGVATDIPGPTFVMVKKTNGFAPDRNDWWYALHWEKVPAKWQAAMGAEKVYWRSPSSKVDYCWQCHENYSREIGGLP